MEYSYTIQIYAQRMLMILLFFITLPRNKEGTKKKEQRVKNKEQTIYVAFFASKMIKLGNHHTILNLISLLFKQWHQRGY